MTEYSKESSHLSKDEQEKLGLLPDGHISKRMVLALKRALETPAATPKLKKTSLPIKHIRKSES